MRAILLSVLWVLFALPTQAGNPDVDRIGIATHQQMLSQRIVRAACFLAAGVDVETQKKLYQSSIEQFNAQMTMLREGNPDTGLPPEDDKMALNMLNTVGLVWQMMEKKLTEAGDDFTPKLVAQTSVQSLSVLTQLNQYVGRYQLAVAQAHPEDAEIVTMLKAATNQRVLIERATREACMVYLEINGTMIGPQMQGTIKSFVSGAFGLAFSSEREHLGPPPNQDIQDENFVSWQEWTNSEWVFTSTSKGEATAQDIAQLGSSSVWIVDSLENVIASYSALIEST